MMTVLSAIGLVVIGVLLFELIIFFHEGGHFIAAKRSGVQVNEFALGMGPKLFSFTKGETTYSLRLFPIGGYCAMEGEDEDSDNPRAFNNAKIWKRMIIIVAGAFMNIVLGFIMMFVIVVQMPEFSGTTLSAFPERSFSAASGFQAGDKIVKFNNYDILNSQDLSFAIATMKPVDTKGNTLEIYRQDCDNTLVDFYAKDILKGKTEKDNKMLEKVVAILDEGVGKINKATEKQQAKSIMDEYYEKMADYAGIKKFTIPEIEEKETRKRYMSDAEVIRNGERITLKDVQLYTYVTSDDPDTPMVSMDFYVEPIEKNFGTILSETGSRTVSVVRMVWASLCGLVTGQFTFKDVSGPVGAASAIVQVASKGLETGFLEAFNAVFYVMMIITVNLGIFNMLPFPALDGGRLLFLLIEWIFRKPIPRKVESIVNGAGLGLLLLFMAIITVKDVWMLLPFGG